MSEALDPQEIFKRAAQEGRRRLNQGMLALVATGFIAGFSIVFGIAAQAVVHSLAAAHFGQFAVVFGALAFAIGVVLLIVGRAELFSENFFDPIAAFFDDHSPGFINRLLRLWVVTLVLNIGGGIMFVLAFSVDGVMAEGARHSIVSVAEGIERQVPLATLMRSITGGALVALLSFLVAACQSSGARMGSALIIGFLLAVGPFEHVVVSLLHMAFGFILDGELPLKSIAATAGVALVGNLIGGVGIVSLSHAAQAKGEKEIGHRG